MEARYFKTFITSRDISYSYFHASPSIVTNSSQSQTQKPYILLVHGFPFGSIGWRQHVSFFRERGFGLIIPDLIGHGESSKPKDAWSYRLSLICKDLIGVLDHERVEQVIVVGHDLGCGVVSRLANYHPERFLGFAFFTVGYRPPDPSLDKSSLNLFPTQTTKTIGHETPGYWTFFSEDDASKIIEEHPDSYLTLMFAKDPEVWKNHLGPKGAFRDWLMADRRADMWIDKEVGFQFNFPRIQTYGNVNTV
ncbi:Bifunctional epoxide hydrolase 2 [Leucoagaricus sp. SymC.cos]|nr:Bifunctional epoxide hydrolase 2 [Leucoagaricus sp. SymC.cos]